MQSRGAYIALSVITGLLMIVLGGLFVAQPGLSLATIILLLGIFVIVYGVALLIAGLDGPHREPRLVDRGRHPRRHLRHRGVRLAGRDEPRDPLRVRGLGHHQRLADIAHAFMSGLSGGRRVWLVIIGLLGIAVGIVFFVHPVSGIVALLWVAGIYLIVLGVLRIIAGFMNPPQAAAA